jgi:hypothetical protein
MIGALTQIADNLFTTETRSYRAENSNPDLSVTLFM